MTKKIFSALFISSIALSAQAKVKVMECRSDDGHTIEYSLNNRSKPKTIQFEVFDSNGHSVLKSKGESPGLSSRVGGGITYYRLSGDSSFESLSMTTMHDIGIALIVDRDKNQAYYFDSCLEK